MSPGGFPGVSAATPFGVDPMDGAPLAVEPMSLRAIADSVVQSVGSGPDPDDSLRLRELIINILQNNNEVNLTPDQARQLVDSFSE